MKVQASTSLPENHVAACALLQTCGSQAFLLDLFSFTSHPRPRCISKNLRRCARPTVWDICRKGNENIQMNAHTSQLSEPEPAVSLNAVRSKLPSSKCWPTLGHGQM